MVSSLFEGPKDLRFDRWCCRGCALFKSHILERDNYIVLLSYPIVSKLMSVRNEYYLQNFDNVNCLTINKNMMKKKQFCINLDFRLPDKSFSMTTDVSAFTSKPGH